jgi:hypothetical protein
MATKLNDDELVSFKELLMSNEIYLEALVQLLLDKVVFTTGRWIPTGTVGQWLRCILRSVES